MSVPSDAGVCRFCGSVLLVEKMRALDVGAAVSEADDYVCPDCDDAAEDADPNGDGGEPPGAGIA